MGRGGEATTAGEAQDAKLELAHIIFLLRTPEALAANPTTTVKELHEALLKAIKTHKAAPLYKAATAEFGLQKDAALLTSLEADNAKELMELDAKIADAEENLGESEVRDALLAKANFYVRVCDRAAVGPAFDAVEKKTVAIGPKMELQFVLLREGLFYGDLPGVKAKIRKLKEFLASPGGSDWERRNKLKVYEGVYLMMTRDFKGASTLFIESLSTFTTYELFSYSTFVFYTVITAIVALNRVELKAKVVDASEVLTVLNEIPNLQPLLNGLYDCKYATFFSALADIAGAINSDDYIHAHYRYFLREVRIVAYSQFLDSYKSVTLANMATAFGVTTDFLDSELALFIAAGRLNCKINKVTGVLETTRPDVKNTLYQGMIKNGDLLLNRLQKLARISDLS